MKYFIKSAIGALFVCLSGAAVLLAQSSAPFPKFTGQHVYAEGIPDTYDSVRAAIDEIQKSSPQSYYVVVVRSTGAGAWATRDYVDALYQQWRNQPAPGNLGLDPNRSVLIALAIENRQLAVHMGTQLQSEYGLSGQTIDRKLVTPVFVPHAKAGNYAEGLVALIRAIERHVADRDARRERDQAQEAARVAQIESDAKATLASSEQLLATVKGELAEKQQDRLDVQRLASEVAEAGKLLANAHGQLPRDPSTALAAARQVEGELQRVQAELRGLAATQAQADTQLDLLERLMRQVQQALETQQRGGLAIGPLQAKLDQLATAVQAARSLLPTRPDTALRDARGLEEPLQNLLKQAQGLPTLRQQVQAREQAVRDLDQAVKADFERAKSLGAAVAPSEVRLAAARRQLAEAERLAGTDYPRALVTFQSVEQQLQSERQQLRQLAAARYYSTRTVPLAIVSAILGIVILVLAIRRLMHVWMKRRVARELEAFKQQVVQLSDQLDLLKERHRLLPFTDTDFSEPMSGDTLALYNSVQEALGRYRERWLALMDAWEQAQTKLGAEQRLGTKLLREAGEALQKAAVTDELQAIQRDCAAPLDRLENAHEDAHATLAALETEKAKLEKQLAAIRDAALSTTPYQSAWDASVAAIDSGRKLLTTDPIRARTIFDEVRQKVNELLGWTANVLKQAAAVPPASAKLKQAEEAVAERRAAGFLLSEPDASPDPLLAQGREELQAAQEGLNHGDAEAAGRHLQKAVALAEQALQFIANQVAAKAFTEKELVARREESRPLQQQLQRGQSQQQELEREFAPDSWRGVSGNLPRAAQLLAGFESQIDQAAAAAASDVQHYVRAAAILTRVQQEQQEAGRLIAAVGKRLQELQELRTRGQTQRHEIESRAKRVGEFLRQQTADRPASNQRYQLALQALQETERSMAGARPDWPLLLKQLDEVRGGLDKAEQLAQEDIRLAQQAAADLAEAEREVRRVKSFYELGISPDVSGAEQQLAQARRSFQSQAYEQCLQQTNAAQQAARDAYNEASRRVQWKRTEMDQERRRREAASAAQAAAMFGAGVLAGSSRQHGGGSMSPSITPVSAPTISPSDSGSGSWSSGSSQTSW
jgi:uncharacterized membrane protein YgcG